MHRRPPRDRSRVRLAPVALLLLLTAAAARAQPSSCQFSVAAVGATFDLSPLRLPATSMGYTVGAGFASQNYSYTFNLCDSLGREPAPSCVEVPPAPTIGPAYQLSSDRQQCFRLGASAAVPNVQWSLLAAQDPSAGVSITYLNGAKCGSGAQAFARQLTLRLRCDATATSVSQLSAERVQETSTCHYSLDVATVFACPRECPIGSNRALCSAHGLCAFDSDLGAPRCFCDAGFSSADCSVNAADSTAADVSSASSSIIGSSTALGFVGNALIVACIVLVLLLMASWALFMRLSHMKPAEVEFALHRMGLGSLGVDHASAADGDDTEAMRHTLDHMSVRAAAPSLFSIGDDVFDGDSSQSSPSSSSSSSTRGGGGAPSNQQRKAYSSALLLSSAASPYASLPTSSASASASASHSESDWPAPVVTAAGATASSFAPAQSAHSQAPAQFSLGNEDDDDDDGDAASAGGFVAPRYMAADDDDLLREDANNRPVYGQL